MTSNETVRFTIGIAGGSGSGKSTAVGRLLERLGSENVSLLEQDAYYLDEQGLSFRELAERNYDHPASVDQTLLAQHVRELQAGRSINSPIYDFARHRRNPETRRVESRRWILVEGIHVLASEEVRSTLHLAIYIETDPDIRLARRIRRDIHERGRTVEGVLAQWEATVRPMHLAFVEPSKRFAHLIIPEAGLDGPALEVLVSHALAARSPEAL